MDFCSILRWNNSLRRQPDMYACCRDFNNLIVVEEQEFKAVRKCSVCGNKHYWMRAEAGNMRAMMVTT